MLLTSGSKAFYKEFITINYILQNIFYNLRKLIEFFEIQAVRNYDKQDQ